MPGKCGPYLETSLCIKSGETESVAYIISMSLVTGPLPAAKDRLSYYCILKWVCDYYESMTRFAFSCSFSCIGR